MAEITDEKPHLSVSLGEIESARSRHMWTRSSVWIHDDYVIVGQWDGTVTAVDRETADRQWTVTHPESAVSLHSLADTVVVGGRGEDGIIAAYDAGDGSQRWAYETAADVGEPTSDSLFYQPYALGFATDGDRLYALSRRYERDGETRTWQSVVLAFDPDGTVAWRYTADASPIALDTANGHLAVGYNRSFGNHPGLAVLDTATGTVDWTWDPEAGGDRRVGDVSFDSNRLAVTCHADKRGYVLENGGEVRWAVDLATETTIGAETLYAYPNHVVAHEGTVAFITGNTYALDGRETEGRHPNDHRLAAFDDTGDFLWEADTGGFVHGVATDGETLLVPSAQNFRVRDPDTHGVHQFDLATGDQSTISMAGIATAAAVDATLGAAIEEPIEYHDDGVVRGSYALHTFLAADG